MTAALWVAVRPGCPRGFSYTAGKTTRQQHRVFGSPSTGGASDSIPSTKSLHGIYSCRLPRLLQKCFHSRPGVAVSNAPDLLTWEQVRALERQKYRVPDGQTRSSGNLNPAVTKKLAPVHGSLPHKECPGRLHNVKTQQEQGALPRLPACCLQWVNSPSWSWHVEGESLLHRVLVFLLVPPWGPRRLFFSVLLAFSLPLGKLSRPLLRRERKEWTTARL